MVAVEIEDTGMLEGEMFVVKLDVEMFVAVVGPISVLDGDVVLNTVTLVGRLLLGTYE